MSSLQQVDVIVIGAGVSGLASAHELQKLTNQSIELVVLEAKDRIGGRTYGKSLPCSNGEEEWDLGGQYVNSNQEHLWKLLKDFNLETYPQYSTGIKKFFINSSNGVRSYSGSIPPMSVLELLDLERCFSKIDKLAKQIPIGAPFDCPKAIEWDGQTFKSFIDATCTFSVTKKFMSFFTRGVEGAESSQVSLFYFLYQCTLSGGLEKLPDASEEHSVKGTVSKLAYKLQDKIGSDRVFCGDAVRTITQNNDSVIVKTLHGKEYQAKYIVCAIPPHLVNQIHFEPPLPLNRVQLGMRMPMGNMIKCIATYRTTFWRTNGVSAESTLLCDQPGVGPLSGTLDATSSSGSPALVGFIGGEHAVYWSQKTQNERKVAVIECLVTLFGKEAETDLIHYEDKDWSTEPYVGGCPNAFMQPGCLVYFNHALKEPFRRMHWAGTETATKWSGYIDGAIESGYRAAKEVADRLKAEVEHEQSKYESETPSPIFSAAVSNKKNMAEGRDNSVKKRFQSLFSSK